MTQRETLIIELVAGEDFAAQIFWTDEDGDALPIKAPCRMEVRDSVGALILQFATENIGNYTTKAAIGITGSQGLLQISVPTVVTKTLIPGVYRFDLWVTSDGGVSPFAEQDVAIASGTFIVGSRVTIMEGALV